jgi:hypothetical protein
MIILYHERRPAGRLYLIYLWNHDIALIIMAFPKHLDNEKIEKLLLIIERNRWDRLRLRGEQQDVVVEEKAEEDDEKLSPDNVRVVIFGAESAFTKSLIEMFRVITVVTYFDNPESMITFCLDHPVQNIIFDIDPPSDYHLTVDAFAAIKMLIPSVLIFACTGRKKSLETDYLTLHGTTIIEKPIFRNHVKKFCEKYVT